MRLAHTYGISSELREVQMSQIAYFRVSSKSQSVEAQRHALQQSASVTAFDREFADEGVSGSVLAAKRPGFASLLSCAREGDVLHVYAIDRLGRDALDVQATVRGLIQQGVQLEVRGLGRIGRGVGELILAVLAQVADLERQKIEDRTSSGRLKARDSLLKTGKTHRGALSLGRPFGRVGTPGEGRKVNPADVVAWRSANKSSIAETARQWGVSTASVKRWCSAITD